MKSLSPATKIFVLWLLLTIISLPVVAETEPRPFKVVYHMDDARAGRFALHIAEDHLKTNPNIEIAIVSYAAGVDFLLKGATDRDGKAYAPDVQALLAQGVKIKMCAATLRFRDIPRSRALDGVEFVPAGTYEVIRLQAEEGYVYLKP